jgi:hypothetical protein
LSIEKKDIAKFNNCSVHQNHQKVTARFESEIDVLSKVLFLHLHELVPYGFGDKLCPTSVSHKFLFQNLIDLVAQLGGQFHVDIALWHRHGFVGSFYVVDGSHMEHRCCGLETKQASHMPKFLKAFFIAVALYTLIFLLFIFALLANFHNLETFGIEWWFFSHSVLLPMMWLVAGIVYVIWRIWHA